MEVGQLNNSVIAIIQARMSSTRLPGKVLLPLPVWGNVTMLEVIVKQLRQSTHIGEVIVATSTDIKDREIVDLCMVNGISYYTGHLTDVFSRFSDILETKDNIKTVVRVTGDNPLLDINILDGVIQQHTDIGADYTYTQGLPLGMNMEVFSKPAFLEIDKSSLSDAEKEHVTLKFKHDKGFVNNKIVYPNDYEKIRVTVDYPSDFLLVSSLFQLAIERRLKLGLTLIEFVSNKYPWLLESNQSNIQKRQFSNLEEEITLAKELLNTYDLKQAASKL